MARPAAVVFGCKGLALSDAERRFFRETDPLGLILFLRNCDNPGQVRALVDDFRDVVGRADAPVLIDQEGGRVARLRPPHWRAAPAAGVFSALAKDDPERAVAAARLNARLIAAELFDLGITVDCTPVLDIPVGEADPIIGDRAAGDTPERAALLGRAVCEGLLDGGVLPVIKHVPGHGRARVDSHKALPVVEASREALEAVDFPPFAALADMPWAMTAHIVYSTIDAERPATTSAKVISEIIRGRIGFDGVLVSDDLTMEALSGDLRERAESVLAAGCDLVLHCDGDLGAMRRVAAGCRPLTENSVARVVRAETRRGMPAPLDKAAARDQLTRWLAGK